jgi:hypothetical protein
MLTWIKTHKLSTVLLVIVGFAGLNVFTSALGLGSTTNLSMPTLREYGSSRGGVIDSRIGAPSGIGYPQPPQPYEPISQSENRVVVQSSDLSLLVKDVRATGDQIIDHAKNVGGFMVTTSYNSPDESPFAQITVRVPTEELDDSLKYFRSLAVKVTSENLVGTDVTEQYEDLDTRLATLRATKAKFDEILSRAVTVQEILEVQRELINLQQQIDFTLGQKMALSDNAKLTKITVYLSSDELSLPYVPDTSFRPNLIFKQAVRSLVGSLRGAGSALIWIAVYSVIWVPLVGAYILFMRYRRRSNKSPSTP